MFKLDDSHHLKTDSFYKETQGFMKEKPAEIKLSADKVRELQAKIATTNLNQADQDLLSGLISSCLWLQAKVASCRMTIKQLRSIFGITTEKKQKEPKKTNEAVNAANDQDCNTKDDLTSNKPISKKGGKNSAEQYTGLPTTIIEHEILKSGDPCPECVENGAAGKVYTFEPGVIIKLIGNPIISGEKFIINKLRCNLCNTIFAPAKYNELKQIPKYAASCSVAIAVNKYQLGSAFTRIDKLQAMLGIPLPKSTQWDLVNDLGFNVEPAFNVIEAYAAQSNEFGYDDSPHKILDLPDDANRSTTRTTAIITKYENHAIKLFYTSTNIASENIAELLAKRVVDGEIVTMTDGAETNFTTAIPLNILSQMIVCFCLVHSRRNFYKLLDYFKVECNFVIDCLKVVYKNEKFCKDHNLSALERLEYHRTHSKPTMDALKIWLINQLQYISRAVEPNNALGVAIKYMLKNWQELTKFLVVAGVPIDNNYSEQLIKCAILHRKNSLFYKTTRGAKVGSMLMSLIQTATANKVNPFEYLVALHEHNELVKLNPHLWLPWNYTTQLNLVNNVA